MTLHINMWSGPRNVSTATMYAFAQRSDTHAIDEPLYGHYLKVTGVAHPGDAEVMDHMDCDGERVVREVILGEYKHPVVFFKNMAHHLVELKWDFLSQTKNILLTRDPEKVIFSLSKKILNPTLRDTGFQVQSELLDTFIKSGQQPPVLDSKQLLLNPSGVLEALCTQIGIPFDKEMLSWPAGPKPEDGIWAKHWYHNAHRSTGFAPYQEKNVALPDHLKPLLEACKPHYEKLLQYAIMADDVS